MQSNPLCHQLVAHRGDQQHYPENSLSALQAAVADGRRFLEFDVQLSADLVPMVHHDLSLQRTCGVDGSIVDKTSHQLALLAASEPSRLGQRFCHEPIPTLQATIEWYQFILPRAPDLQLFIELKEESIQHFGHQQVLDAVQPILSAVSLSVIIISFDTRLLAQLRNCEPRTGLILRQWPASASTLEIVQPDFLILNQRHIAANERLDNQPLPVMLYEIENRQQADHWLERGASLLESFDCNRLLADTTGTCQEPVYGSIPSPHLACYQP